MAKYIAKFRLAHNGKLYSPGEQAEMSDEQAKALGASVEPARGESPKEAKGEGKK